MRTGIIQGRRITGRAATRIRMLSVGQAATELDVSPSTVRNWVEKGYIHAFRLPSGVRRIPQDEITRLVNQYFAAPVPVEGQDEPTIQLDPERESGVAAFAGDVDLADSDVTRSSGPSSSG